MDSETLAPSFVTLSEKVIDRAEFAHCASVTTVIEVTEALRDTIDLFDRRRKAASLTTESGAASASKAVASQCGDFLADYTVQQIRDLCRIFLEAIKAAEAAQAVSTGLAMFAA